MVIHGKVTRYRYVTLRYVFNFFNFECFTFVHVLYLNVCINGMVLYGMVCILYFTLLYTTSSRIRPRRPRLNLLTYLSSYTKGTIKTETHTHARTVNLLNFVWCSVLKFFFKKVFNITLLD